MSGAAVRGATIEVRQLSRAFGQVVALNEVSFDVAPGIVGLLGPNGAGKSTLLKILTGELRPSLGSVRVLGLDPFANPEYFARIAVAPEQEALFEDVTGREFITFMLKLRGHDAADAGRRAEEHLDAMGLADAMHRKIGGYSKGMRQRCKLAAVFSADAEALFLDEPLTGLDPVWRHRIQTRIRERAEAGVTVVFSSHVLHEVEQATRQVLLLHRGRLAAQGEAREIRAMVDKHPHRIHVECARPREIGARLLAWDSVESVRVTPKGLLVTTPKPDRFYASLTEASAAEDLGVTGLHSPDDSLAALFETLVGG
ncbi:MAG: Vitamin B12 import ATP-binding protein BtuD [Planctomycetes bacterium]|nr:Vitamin B12 import ATP-binding protein BtuD [Planctomycetota bacterium]